MASPTSAASPKSGDVPLEGRGDNIRVFVRVRPLNSREDSSHFRETIRTDAEAGTVHLCAEPPRSFAFDGVLPEPATQDDVFNLFGTDVGEACLRGYNGSIYVYGQTGSGKTHTMQGPVESVQSMHSDERRGLMCRILELIFSEIGRRHGEGGSVQYSCKCSYLEIYKEQITDLLEPGSSNLQVREDINRGIYVERLSEHSAWTVSDAYHVLWKGLHQRHVASTQMNELSSRSHAVFTLKLEATSTTTGGVTSTRVARLNLIDLAGSERQSSDPNNPSLHESLRVKEAGAINRSLSALTNVIMSLSHGIRRRNSGGGQRRPFVRYRDSKLTFLLKDSLGGNSRTVIVACVSPSALCFGETLSTLKFAARAKHIRCAAVMNEEYSGTVESLMLEVKSLRQQLELLSSRGLAPSGAEARESKAVMPAASRRAGQRPEGAIAASGLDVDEAYEAILTETMDEDDLHRLYGARRIRRLEILLAAALERERRCELRRHRLEKFTQYLDGALERKEQYFDALRDYFAFLVDHAAGEACYLPEFTARLVVFRQQLCNASTDCSRQQATEMLDGTIEAFLAAEAEGLLDETGSGGDSSPDRMSPQRWLASELQASRSRSYSYGLLMGEAARRSGRRSQAQMLQLRASQEKLIGGASVASLASPMASSTALPAACENSVASFGHALSGSAGGPVEEELSNLRSENRFLRRQLENHPELHRLGAENRLLREHLASLVQQQALAREEPPWPRGHRHHRRAMDGILDSSTGEGKTALQPDKERNSLLAGNKSLTHSKSSMALPFDANEGGLKAAAKDRKSGGDLDLSSRPFPGIDEAQQISPSTSSCSEGEHSDGLSRREMTQFSRGSATTATDVAAFLPTMARQIEELFRVKSGLEDSLRRLLRPREPPVARKIPGEMGRFVRVPSGELPQSAATQIDVDPQDASDALRGAAGALRSAEGMVAKGGVGETLLLGTGIGDDEAIGTSGLDDSWGLRNKAEGMDERDVFLSLMKSLPRENQTLNRQGFASSAPHLPGSGRARSSGLLSSFRSGVDSSSAIGTTPTLRASNSTGSAGSRLQRIRSTIQLHRIVEGPGTIDVQSPSSGFRSAGNGLGGTNCPGSPDTSGDAESAGDILRAASGQVRHLCQHLENVGEAYRDVQKQIPAMQQEFARRIDECRFLEAQCRRLDVHCRLLEERVQSAEASGAISRRHKSITSPISGSMQPKQLLSGAPLTSDTGLGSGYSGVTGSLQASPRQVSPHLPQQQLSSGPGLKRRSVSAATLPSALRGGAVATHAQHSGLLLGASATQLSRDAEFRASPAAQFTANQQLLRRVVSAPQLQHAGPRASLDPGAALRPSANEGSALFRPGGGASSIDTMAPNLALPLAATDASFKSSVFLSLARQPGAKTAALQYLVSSTSSALGIANGEVAATASRAALATTNSGTSLTGQGSTTFLPHATAATTPSHMHWASQGGMGHHGFVMPVVRSASSRALHPNNTVMSVQQQTENRRNQPSQLGELLGATFVSMPGSAPGSAAVPVRAPAGVATQPVPRPARFAPVQTHSMSGGSLGMPAGSQAAPQHFHMAQQPGHR
eukprot:TRINITY_DN21054_c0_g1_i1.p1 TRINITY_DN21054_c0_g1~~TRINITY_DN21054_c0_g1_i1.p1  ORF type:complete len:1638 (-),score=316.20 TRINITY_DN21054_c0_g1_i1:407-5146(-)